MRVCGVCCVCRICVYRMDVCKNKTVRYLCGLEQSKCTESKYIDVSVMLLPVRLFLLSLSLSWLCWPTIYQLIVYATCFFPVNNVFFHFGVNMTHGKKESKKCRELKNAVNVLHGLPMALQLLLLLFPSRLFRYKAGGDDYLTDII